MNEHKFCFIICANKEKIVEECLWYIDQLFVPDGYEKETLVIRGASSMTSGYNQAMTQSDAKYKIYLHQDVLIVNQNVLEELLEIFKEPAIGMVGAVGTCRILSGADYTLSWDVGGVEVSVGINSQYLIGEAKGDEKLADVTCIDGVFMATQYDLLWEEEIFDGWDFYDISQSLIFRRAGYKVVVPWIRKKEEIWVYHDKGRSVYDAWERYRKIFCDRYKSSGYEYVDTGIQKSIKQLSDQQHDIMSTFQSGDFESTNELLKRLGEDNLNMQLCYVALFLSIRQAELETIGSTRFSNVEEFGAFIDIFDEIKFMCRRIYFGNTEEVKEAAWKKLEKMLCRGDVTMMMIWATVYVSIGDADRLWWNVFARFQKIVHSFLLQGEVLAAERLLTQLDEKRRGKEGNILLILIRVFRREVEKGVSPTVFDVSQDPEELTAHFIHLKLYLRRLEFGLPEQYQDEVYDYCKENGVSDYLILHILQNNIFYKEDFCRRMSQLFAKREGMDSMKANLYAQLAEK